MYCPRVPEGIPPPQAPSPWANLAPGAHPAFLCCTGSLSSASGGERELLLVFQLRLFPSPGVSQSITAAPASLSSASAAGSRSGGQAQNSSKPSACCPRGGRQRPHAGVFSINHNGPSQVSGCTPTRLPVQHRLAQWAASAPRPPSLCHPMPAALLCHPLIAPSPPLTFHLHQSAAPPPLYPCK